MIAGSGESCKGFRRLLIRVSLDVRDVVKRRLASRIRARSIPIDGTRCRGKLATRLGDIEMHKRAFGSFCSYRAL